ncbi:MAG: hypothetical protein WDM96_07305 [Lacunisphaera sp.]
MQSKASLLAWITCDGVHIDPASGKHTILGVFSNIKAMAFPVMHPYMVWFLTLTDVQPGTHHIKMSMGLNPTDPTELLNREFESKSPLHRINLINELRKPALRATRRLLDSHRGRRRADPGHEPDRQLMLTVISYQSLANHHWLFRSNRCVVGSSQAAGPLLAAPPAPPILI